MDSVLKFVYSDYYFENGKRKYFPNGVHFKVIEKIKKNLLIDKPVYETLNEIEHQNNNSNWNYFFRQEHFFSVYKKYYDEKNIISIEEIKDDNSINLFVVEVSSSIFDLYEKRKLFIDNELFCFTFFESLSIKIKDKIISGKIKLLISIPQDPLISIEQIRNLEIYFDSMGVNCSNIIILGGNNLQEYFNDFPNSKIKITNASIFLNYALEQLNSFPYVSSLGYISDAVRIGDLNNLIIRNKKFLSWNRSMRVNRVLLLYCTIKHKLLEDGYFSFLNFSNINYEYLKSIIIDRYDNSEESYNILNILKNLQPIEIDTQHLSENQKYGFASNNNNKDLYLNSYIHIITETVFDSNVSSPFLSEKTFRPIINLQPFILIGGVGYLKHLKCLGFKTFSPFIDESYDEEIDSIKRFKLIELEIEKLNKKSIFEIHNWYYSITDILVYNQNHLMNFSSIPPFEKCFDDIKNIYK